MTLASSVAGAVGGRSPHRGVAARSATPQRVRSSAADHLPDPRRDRDALRDRRGAAGRRASAASTTIRPRCRSCQRVGALLDPDVERILSLQPGSRRRLRQPGRPARAARARADPDLRLQPRGARGHHRRRSATLGERVGREQRSGRSRAQIETRIAAVRTAGRGPAAAAHAARLRPGAARAARHLRERRRRVHSRHGRRRGRRQRVRRRQAAGRAGDDRADPREAARRDPRAARRTASTPPIAGDGDRASGRRCASVPAVRSRRVYFLDRADAPSCPGRASPKAIELHRAARFIPDVVPGDQMMKILVSWSSGKDSAWMLHVLRSEGLGEPAALLTTVNESANRVAMHARQDRGAAGAGGRRRPAADDRADPVTRARTRSTRRRCRAAIATAKADGFTHVAFGDLFLEDVRRYREERMAGTGLTPIFPLWLRPTDGARARDDRRRPGGVPHVRRSARRCRRRSPAGGSTRAARRSAAGIDPVRRTRRVSHLRGRRADVHETHRRRRRAMVVERDGFVFADLSSGCVAARRVARRD